MKYDASEDLRAIQSLLAAGMIDREEATELRNYIETIDARETAR